MLFVLKPISIANIPFSRFLVTPTAIKSNSRSLSLFSKPAIATKTTYAALYKPRSNVPGFPLTTTPTTTTTARTVLGQNHYSTNMMAHNNKEKVCILGSGNWGTTAARILANNVKSLDNIDKTINMYVYEELIDGKKLTEIINTQHENVKYLPGFKIPENVIAVPDVVEAVKDANLIVIVMPHQFVKSVLETIKPHIIPSKTKVLSLIKGVVITPKGTVTVSNLIKENLGIHDVSVLSGANIANEIADEQFCESTIGYQVEESAKLWQLLFETPNFRLNCINDVIGVELCGALKNVVAIAAGFVDGLKLGNNSKAAIIRIGLVEMRKIAPYFSDSVKGITFLESCGVADLITTCYGGRNRKLAELFVTTGKSMQELEKIHLNGQKLQGYLTAQEVYEFMVERGIVDEFPLFTKIYKICYEGENVASIFCDLKVSLL